MKKIVSIFAAAVLAAGFMGCSNDSDDNSALMLALASQSSGGISLPASVGENNLSGNTYKAGNDARNVTYEFSSNSFTVTSNEKFDAVAGVNTAYTLKTVTTYSYSYDSDEGIIFINNASEKRYIVRGEKETPYKLRSFSNDAEFIEAVKAYFKITCDLMSDTELEAGAKSLRYNTFEGFWYNDSSNVEEVSELSIGLYNLNNSYMAHAASFITPYAYKVNSSSFEISSSPVYPKNSTLVDLYTKKYAFVNKYDNTNYFIINKYINTYSVDSSFYLADIFNSYSGIESFYGFLSISGISSDTISLKKFMESADPWSYTETEVSGGRKVTLSEGSTEKGNFVIPYKTSSTSYATYEKQ